MVVVSENEWLLRMRWKGGTPSAKHAYPIYQFDTTVISPNLDRAGLKLYGAHSSQKKQDGEEWRRCRNFVKDYRIDVNQIRRLLTNK